MFLTPCQLGLSPLEAALRLKSEPGLAWLDGGLTHGDEGRFSFVGCRPIAVVERYANDPSPLAALDDLENASDRRASLAPGHGYSPGDVPAWIGHVAYDARAFGPRRALAFPVPVVRFARYDALFMFDHERSAGFLVGDGPESCAALDALLARPCASPRDREDALAFEVGPLQVGAAARHAQNVRAALEQITEGNVYEVNLARRYHAPFRGSPLGLFLRMRERSPVPFGYFVESTDHAVLGRSMERFLRFRARDRALWTSPIKGTIARQGDGEAEAKALLTNPKEHAEHAMVVDLMRNDLSRVAVAGSVRIRDLMRVVPFAGLSHLVSTVEATARDTLSLRALLEGTFPPGSVTGAPKESAVRLIDALEEFPRGIYTGAVGYIDREGGCSLAVAIRTAVTHGGQVAYFAGGGIVADSDPEAETAETDLKAQVFLRCL